MGGGWFGGGVSLGAGFYGPAAPPAPPPSVLDPLESAWDDVISTGTGLFTDAMSAADQLVSDVAQVGQDLTDTVSGGLDAAGGALTDTGNALNQFAADVGKVGQDLKNEITPVVTNAANAAGTALTQAGTWAQNHLPNPAQMLGGNPALAGVNIPANGTTSPGAPPDRLGHDQLIVGKSGDPTGVYYQMSRGLLNPRRIAGQPDAIRLGDLVYQDGEAYLVSNGRYVPLREVQNNVNSTWGATGWSTWNSWIDAHRVDLGKSNADLRWRDAGESRLRQALVEKYGTEGKRLLERMDKAEIGILHGQFGPGGSGDWRFRNNNDIEIDTDYNFFPIRGDRTVNEAADTLIAALRALENDGTLETRIQNRSVNQEFSVISQVDDNGAFTGQTTLTANGRWLRQSSHEGLKAAGMSMVMVGTTFLPIPGVNAAFDALISRMGAVFKNGKYFRLGAGGAERELSVAEAQALLRQFDSPLASSGPMRLIRLTRLQEAEAEGLLLRRSLTAGEIEQLRLRMNASFPRGVEIYIDSPALPIQYRLPPKTAEITVNGGTKVLPDGTVVITLRADATGLTALHEYIHAAHLTDLYQYYQHAGLTPKDALNRAITRWRTMSTLESEQAVFDLILSRYWNQLTIQEQRQATEYIMSTGGLAW